MKRVGLSTFNDILNAVAPPISEHEVIQVWLSHDMQGLEGVELLVYSALTRVCPPRSVSLTPSSNSISRFWSRWKVETWLSIKERNRNRRMTQRIVK